MFKEQKKTEPKCIALFAQIIRELKEFNSRIDSLERNQKAMAESLKLYREVIPANPEKIVYVKKP